MSQAKVRGALEKRLLALGSFATAYENFPFTPTTGTPYQRVNLLPAPPDNSTQGSRSYWEQGVFQITLLYPLDKGPGAAEARADAVRQWFKRGTTLLEGGVKVIVTLTPEVARGSPDGDRWSVPVSVRYQAQVTP